MRKFLIIASAVLVMNLWSGKAHALAVIDVSNLTQNTIAAKQIIEQKLTLINQYTTQLEQFQRQLLDALNPGRFAWGDVQSTLNQLQDTFKSLSTLGGKGGGLDGFLGSFGTYETYGSGQQWNSSDVLQPDVYAMKMKKDSSDDLLYLIERQQKDLEKYSSDLESLKSKSESAEGQQQAIQAGNELAVRQK